ncbi:translation initiation factor IF-2-like [Balaenoptera musculus]|uniref:Translation initiation factor IF-2-like n=1 Tax=Balaenoptera musculus TaxID=9771 RepID=A0A8B8YER6_BALMU|nr:translation initiation factor IF-2-like [Balaenoptera musculus]
MHASRAGPSRAGGGRAPSRVRRGSHRGRGGGGGGRTRRGRQDGAAGGRGGGRSGFRGAGGLRRRRLPPDEPPLPSPPPARRKHRPPRRGVAREGGESRAAGRGQARDRSRCSRAGPSPQARPEEGRTGRRRLGQRHLYPSEGGRSGAGEASRRGKNQKGGRGGSREGASRNSLLRQQLGGLGNPRNAWENGARTRLRSATP